ncbi:MAG: DUF1724 domain-containing protein [Thermoplasmata archaeon]|nr:DUF1724 domain-containing protein [Thermoplasmata archaeon]
MQHIYTMYEEVEDKLRFITTSGVRIKMMISLLERPKASGELKDELETSTSTVIHAARDLEKEKLIIEGANGFELTNTGRIVALKTMEYIKSFGVVKKFDNFWVTHDLSDIPDDLLLRIGELADSKIITDTPTDLLRGLSLYFKLVRKAKQMYGISSIFHPKFPDMIEKLANRGVEMKFIVTPMIFKTLSGEKYGKRLKALTEKENFELRLYDRELKLAFTVTDFVLSFALYFTDGNFDSATDLLSYNKEAIKWGRDLFRYYYDKAKVIRPEDI